MRDRRLPVKWVRATWGGWVLGIPLIIVLALCAEAIGIGGAQVIVGAGMGLGIGLMQARIMRDLIDKFIPWVLSCVTGLAIPFLLTDISNVLGVKVPYSLEAAIILGGLIIGIWQALILRSQFDRTWIWVAASAIGWTLAAGMAAISDILSRSRSLRGIFGALAYLVMIAAGGLILGVVTSIAFGSMRRRPKSA